MIQKILLFNLILFLVCYGCKNSNETFTKEAMAAVKKDSLSKEEIYIKIEHFADSYDFDTERKFLTGFTISAESYSLEGGKITEINGKRLNEEEARKINELKRDAERQKKGYNINDSLNFYFSKLSPDMLFNDSEFNYLGGKLLEKRYLYNRKLSKSPETFPVYNMSIINQGSSSCHFALNIVTKMHRNKDAGYKEYSTTGQEFVCIDSVVLALDKIPKMKNDSIHKICLDLVKRNKTGGCKW